MKKVKTKAKASMLDANKAANMAASVTAAVRKIAREIKLLVLDVDGVLTDGSLFFGASGEELKVFYVRDGLGMRRALQGGIEIAVITKRKSEAVLRRMEELGVKYVYMGIDNKEPVLQELADKLGIKYAHIAYIGDDLPDLVAVQKVGLGIAVHDAAAEVVAGAKWRTNASGGRGAVREVCEQLLKARGSW
jgi:3-deoxy-D-manno-octulosonate 8-phosphate phosphatase (KDO 8-P phosphatase)